MTVGVGLLQACAVRVFLDGDLQSPGAEPPAPVIALVFFVVLSALTFSDLFTRA